MALAATTKPLARHGGNSREPSATHCGDCNRTSSKAWRQQRRNLRQCMAATEIAIKTFPSLGGVGFFGSVSLTRLLGDSLCLHNICKIVRGYAVEEMNGIYGLAQCWRTLNRDECRTCLEKASTEVRRCFPSREGRALNAGCYLRYSTEKFYSRNWNKKSGGTPRYQPRVVRLKLAFSSLSSGLYNIYFSTVFRRKKLRNSYAHALPLSKKFGRTMVGVTTLANLCRKKKIDPKEIPNVMRLTIGKSYVFRIRVDDYNLKDGLENYTVLRTISTMEKISTPN